MVLAMSLLRVRYSATILAIIFLSVFIHYPTIVALLLCYLLVLLIQSIPLNLAWHRSSFKRLIHLCIATIAFSIIIYALIYYRSGLMQNGVLIQIQPMEALYFSITTWATLGYGDLTAPKNLHHITSIEALNGYFAMAIFVALIVIWINESISSLDERMNWIRSLTPEQVQKIQDEIDPSVKINDVPESSSKKAGNPTH